MICIKFLSDMTDANELVEELVNWLKILKAAFLIHRHKTSEKHVHEMHTPLNPPFI